LVSFDTLSSIHTSYESTRFLINGLTEMLLLYLVDRDVPFCAEGGWCHLELARFCHSGTSMASWSCWYSTKTRCHNVNTMVSQNVVMGSPWLWLVSLKFKVILRK
jgi:hypothetical protein